MSHSSAPKLLFLGTGTSTGVPRIGCDCAVCTSQDPRNQRLRSSVYLTYNGFGILVDTTPDFRQQMLRSGIRRIDAVMITHGHADHIFGMDDLRQFNTIQQTRIPVYVSSPTLKGLTRIFEYFLKPVMKGLYLPQVDFVSIAGPIEVGPFRVTPFEVEHGVGCTWGFRFDCEGRSLAYAPDCAVFPEAALEVVRGVDVMVLDALRHRSHVSHMTVGQSLATLNKIGAGRSFTTHMAHDLDYETLAHSFPEGVLPAYDGLEVVW